MKHPLQSIIIDKNGVARFLENSVVTTIVGKLDFNSLSLEFHDRDDDDWDQFLQLIGYSVSGAPFRNELIRDSADMLYDNKGELDNRDAYIAVLEERLINLKRLFREGVATLYDRVPDDLFSDTLMGGKE